MVTGATDASSDQRTADVPGAPALVGEAVSRGPAAGGVAAAEPAAAGRGAAAPPGRTATPSYADGFRTLDEEVVLDDVPVEGELPAWLEGTLVRNGPARFEPGF